MQSLNKYACTRMPFPLKISDEKAEAAQRETRLQQQVSRQRTRIEELNAEKTELLERIKRLEQARFTLQNTLAEERASRALKVTANVSLSCPQRAFSTVS